MIEILIAIGLLNFFAVHIVMKQRKDQWISFKTWRSYSGVHE